MLALRLAEAFHGFGSALVTTRRRIGAVVTIVTILGGHSLFAGEPFVEASQGRWWRAASPGLSQAFESEVQQAVDSIPEPIWKLVDRAGWRVDAVEYVVDAAPSLRGTAPRGWPPGWLWENTDAVHMPAAKQLVIAEKRRTRKGTIVDCHRVGGVLRHEVGHAFDIMSGRPASYESESSLFHAAYRLDAGRMNAERRTKLRYYLQRGPAGRQEAFAESFAVLYGGGSDVEHRALFEESFRRTIESVKVLVSRRIADR